MANDDRNIPEHGDEDIQQGATPEGHSPAEPTPPQDPHTRPEAEGKVVRPDQQEELGPVAGLMHAAAVEATAEVTNDPQAQAEAEELGVEGEGVEAAQIFTIMLTTAITLGLAVFGVFFLVANYTDDQTVERDATAIYPELREVERVFAEMDNYSREDTLYRIPITAAMQQVSEAYYEGQQGSATVSVPDNFDTLYLDAIRESGSEVREYERDAVGSIGLVEETVPSPGVDLGADTDENASAVEDGNESGVAPENEPEDR